MSKKYGIHEINNSFLLLENFEYQTVITSWYKDVNRYGAGATLYTRTIGAHNYVLMAIYRAEEAEDGTLTIEQDGWHPGPVFIGIGEYGDTPNWTPLNGPAEIIVAAHTDFIDYLTRHHPKPFIPEI